MEMLKYIGSFCGLYITIYIFDSLTDTKKDLKTLKINREKHIIAYGLIDEFQISKPLAEKYPLNEETYPKEIENIVIRFKTYMGENINNLDLERLNNLNITYIKNLHDLKMHFKLLTQNDGTYSPQTNTISIYKLFNKESVLSHEFLHLISTGKNQTSGFYTPLYNEEEDYYLWIGDGLDEGYTELLNIRIFGDKKNAYPYNTEIIKFLEILFDNPKEMEYAYFTNNIFIIYQTFLKYGTKEEFLSLLQTLDNLIETNIPIYKTIITIKTKLNIYNIIKRSQDEDKILAAKKLLEKDPIIKLLTNKNIVLVSKPKQKIKKRKP